jgi:hypothetical protein
MPAISHSSLDAATGHPLAHHPSTSINHLQAKSVESHSNTHKEQCLPKQVQPIGTLYHAPYALTALQSRAQQRNVVAQLSGIHPSSSSIGDTDATAALVILLHPGERWATHPDELLHLLRQLLRGHLKPWSILLYTSRGKALHHCSNLIRAPLRPSHPLIAAGASGMPIPPCMLHPSTRKPLLVHGIVCTHDPRDILLHVARPLGLPLIYFGSDAESLKEVHAHASEMPWTCQRLDQLLGIAEKLRERRNEESSAWPLRAVLRSAAHAGQRSRATALERWIEDVDDLGQPVPGYPGYASDDSADSRPNSPEHMKRRVANAFERARRATDAEQEKSNEETSSKREESKAQLVAALHPSAAEALRSGRRIGLADAAPVPVHSMSTMPGSTRIELTSLTNARESIAKVRSPIYAKLQLDVEPNDVQQRQKIFIVDEHGQARSSASAIPPASSGIRLFEQHSQEQRTPTSARAIVRNPFTTPRSPTTGGPGGNPEGRPGTAGTIRPPTAPLRLSIETRADRQTLDSIAALADRLQAMDLPVAAALPTDEPKRIELPPDTNEKRVAAYAASLPHSPLLRRDARVLLVDEYARSLIKHPGRDLYGLERRAKGAMERREAQVQQWALEDAEASSQSNEHSRRTAAASAAILLGKTHEIKTGADGLFDIAAAEREDAALGRAGVGGFARSAAYRAKLIDLERAELESAAQRRRAERARLFNEAQSTAREIALKRIPDAPRLSNLQAAFLSPRSRARRMGPRAQSDAALATLEHARTERTAPASSLLSADGTPLSPSAVAKASAIDTTATSSRLSAVQLAAGVAHQPTRAELESALRADFELQAEERRWKEKQDMHLTAAVHAQIQEQRRRAWDQGKRHRASIAHIERTSAQIAEDRVQLREMLRVAFGDEEDEAAEAETRRIIREQEREKQLQKQVERDIRRANNVAAGIHTQSDDEEEEWDEDTPAAAIAGTDSVPNPSNFSLHVPTPSQRKRFQLLHSMLPLRIPASTNVAARARQQVRFTEEME